MVVADISCVPVGTRNTSVSPFVAAAVRELRRLGFRPRVNALDSEFEARSAADAFRAALRAHEALFRHGASRVQTTVKLDDRRDRKSSIGRMIRSADSKARRR
jgi:uncharacterized protein (TIGR00106 family)